MSPLMEEDGFCEHERGARKIGCCCLERRKVEDEEQGRRTRGIAGILFTALRSVSSGLKATQSYAMDLDKEARKRSKTSTF